MSRLKFIVVSKDDQHLMSCEHFSHPIHDITLEYIDNNIRGLPVVYNQVINIERNTNDNDFIIFMHADVKLGVIHLIDHILECKDKYDMMGLCGTEVLTVSQSPLNWWTGSHPTPDRRWGCVTHGEMNNQTSFFSSHHPDVYDHEVACIDGLCMILGPNILKSQFLFDESFQWNQYDTDASLQIVMKYHLKLGVLVHKDLMHYSVGKGILKQDFIETEKILRQKWQF